MDLSPQVQPRWLSGVIQCSLGPPRLHPASRRGLGETFSPVVKPATIRVVLSLAAGSSWPIHQLDVKNAFLHGHLAETVYSSQPAGFIDSSRPRDVCRLNRSLYGLKQAPRAWFARFTSFLLSLGFHAPRPIPHFSPTADRTLRIFFSTSKILFSLPVLRPSSDRS